MVTSRDNVTPMPIARACCRIAVAARSPMLAIAAPWMRSVATNSPTPNSRSPIDRSGTGREIDHAGRSGCRQRQGHDPRADRQPGNPSKGPHPFAQHDRPRRRGVAMRTSRLPRCRSSVSDIGATADKISKPKPTWITSAQIPVNNAASPLPGIRPKSHASNAPTIQQAVVAPIVSPTRMVIQAEGRERCHSRQRTGLWSSDGAGSTRVSQPSRPSRGIRFRPDSSPSPWPVAFSRRPEGSGRPSRPEVARKKREQAHQAVVLGARRVCRPGRRGWLPGARTVDSRSRRTWQFHTRSDRRSAR